MNKNTIYLLGFGIILTLGVFLGVTGCDKPDASSTNTIVNTGN